MNRFFTLLKPAAIALRTYWPAILVIQVLALCVVVSYYKVDGTAEFFSVVAGWKVQGGILFAAISTVISGGILPEVLKRIFRPAGVKAPAPGELANQFAMWAGLGILIDQFYQLQGHIFGHGTGLATLLLKTLVDQLLFSPLITQPYIVACFMLHETRYRPVDWIAGMTFKKMVNRVLPLWMTCLTFWPVMLLVIYSLPGDLQFPLFLFVNSAYSILMIFIARRQVCAGVKGDSGDSIS
jgi:hypothetical protein